jgi:hypothetical protein
MAEKHPALANVGVSVAGRAQVKAPEEISEVDWFPQSTFPQPLLLPLQHFVEGKVLVSRGSAAKTDRTDQMVCTSAG